MTTLSRLQYRDTIVGHGNVQAARPPVSPAGLALLVLTGLAGGIAAVGLVFQLYPMG